jgi:hypothetical protein
MRSTCCFEEAGSQWCIPAKGGGLTGGRYNAQKHCRSFTDSAFNLGCDSCTPGLAYVHSVSDVTYMISTNPQIMADPLVLRGKLR